MTHILTQHNSIGQVYFLSNIRWMLAILLVFFHASLSYSSAAPWWYVIEPSYIRLLDIFILLFDTFAIPLFFFISGYFAMPSLKTHGAAKFIKRKFQRLIIPWMIGVSMVGPLTLYLRHYYRISSQGYIPVDYFAYWKIYIKSGFELYTGYMPTLEQFSLHHFWFLSLLFTFFMVLCFYYALKNKWISTSSKETTAVEDVGRNISFVIIILGLVNSIFFFILNQLYHDMTHLDVYWVMIGSFLQFQPTRLILYISYFILGVYAFSKKWFSNERLPGSIPIWSVISILLFILLLFIVDKLISTPEPNFLLCFIFALVRSFVCLSFIVLFLVFSLSYLNRPVRIFQFFSSHSYNIYLIHYLIVIIFQYLLLSFGEIPLIIKFIIVAVASLMITLGISKYLLEPFPRLFVLFLFVGFSLMCFFFRPAIGG